MQVAVQQCVFFRNPSDGLAQPVEGLPVEIGFKLRSPAEEDLLMVRKRQALWQILRLGGNSVNPLY